MIREMRMSDWEDMMKIYRQSLDRGTVSFKKKSPTYEDWDRNHLRKCRFVCVIDDKVVGYVALSAVLKEEQIDGVGEISIFVDEDYQRQGIGTDLLSTLCMSAKMYGYSTLYSAFFTINKASTKLHKKCGFRPIGYREKVARDKFGIWQKATLMEYSSKVS